ncbi:hypothetical protein [Pedobacter frigidisoli]|uniref:hypothetical protein n=1 Tax=Pedobacter frigidisoli TaxID=2530455 RepID=UPI002930791A|nr:hypothetical protein [Pedobacter frigidisoli]
MDIDSTISDINALHQKSNQAFQDKDMETYAAIFDYNFEFKGVDAKPVNLRDYKLDIQSLFKNSKSLETSHYRIKSSFEDGIFTEKIARKSVIIKSNLILLTKKETIQTEEVYHWKNVNGEWKVISIEVVLEEKY